MDSIDYKSALVQMMTPDRRQGIIWTSNDIIYWHVYTLLETQPSLRPIEEYRYSWVI